MAFAAKWAGTCAECDGKFESGTEIRYDEDDDIVHADPSECSLNGLMDRKERLASCTRCFLVHAGECF